MQPTEQLVEELKRRMADLGDRQHLITMLRDSLATWEQEVDFAGLPEGKQRALLALAEESASTLRSMLERLESEPGGGLPQPPAGH